MIPEQHACALNELKLAHQVLVTKLLDHRHVEKNDLSVLYTQR